MRRKKLNQKAIDRVLKRIKDSFKESQFLEAIANISDPKYCSLRAIEEISTLTPPNRQGDFIKAISLLVMAEVQIEAVSRQQQEET